MTAGVASFGLCRARPGREAELGRHMAELTMPTRAEPGCLRYDLYRDLKDPAVWIFFEEWESAAQLQAHTESAHLRAFLAIATELLEGPPESHAATLVDCGADIPENISP